jgi:hypothetical protein
MKKLKIILISLFILFSVIMIFALLIPADTRVSRAINIRANRDTLKTILLDLKQWPKWHPNLKTGNDSNPVTFSGNALKFNGFTMEVTPATDSSIHVDLTNREGKKLQSVIQMNNLNRDTVAVNWYALFHSDWYPWEKFRSMFYDQLYGPSLDSNLVKFRNFTER